MRNESAHANMRPRPAHAINEQQRAKPNSPAVHNLRHPESKQHTLHDAKQHRKPAKWRRLKLHRNIASMPHRSKMTNREGCPTAENQRIRVVLLNCLARVCGNNLPAQMRMLSRNDLAPLLILYDGKIARVPCSNQPLAQCAVCCADLDNPRILRPKIGGSHGQAARRCRFSSLSRFSAGCVAPEHAKIGCSSNRVARSASGSGC